MSPLAETLRSEIARSGPIPFSRFMERALYDPEHGYYTGERRAVGRGGDYITSVSVGPLYGKLIAGQVEEMWRNLGAPPEFVLVEQGAESGDFAADLLAASGAWPEFAAALRYRILEPFAANRARQQKRLAPWEGRVCWFSAMESLPPFTGVHFSNELIDAFPVHRLARREGEWREQYVGAGPDRLEWVEQPLSTPELEAFLPHLPAVEGYQTEVNLEARRWVAELAARLERGYLLAADYGFSRADYYLPERIDGTLTGYRAQRRADDPLADPGLQDLTAHVEFTTLAEHAAQAGLRLAGFADQHRFMVALGKRAFPDATAPLTPERQREMRAFASLMHPALMGRGFKFIAFAKEAPLFLHGFEFASDPNAALGLR